MAKKKNFTVEDGETIDECLERMKAEGFHPVRRMEKPILKEVKQNGKIEVVADKQRIVFEGKKLDS
ncbi:NETI motif-containing protein [Salisediminibacterium beveridgei]|uniref:NETI protein n=1 Tax=Salisediminibacterium beveridgei TaxID=632773 RepID=A0A1D7QY87_9BACI|nr:NETI motif-containing protein [Salisediminibacterium beveridgei]AOM83970.1 hypothetical protein BBEV_2632 [Salisediminibacterium beveridgei]